MANRNFASGGKIYSMHVKPVIIDCNFVVDSTANAGITSLKGPLVQNVFMNTSGTAADAGNRNPQTPNTPVNNPDPVNGVIVVQLQDSYNRIFDIKSARANILSGTPLKIDNAELTQGQAVTITVLGNATAANWRSVGLPAGVTAAVGVSFIAANTGIAGNTLTSRVQASATASTVASIEIVGSMQQQNQMNPDILAQGFGAQIILQCRDFAGALAAPPNGSQIMLELYMSDSSITVAGE